MVFCVADPIIFLVLIYIPYRSPGHSCCLYVKSQHNIKFRNRSACVAFKVFIILYVRQLDVFDAFSGIRGNEASTTKTGYIQKLYFLPGNYQLLGTSHKSLPCPKFVKTDFQTGNEDARLPPRCTLLHRRPRVA